MVYTETQSKASGQALNINLSKKLAWVAALSCAACCAIVPILTLAGITGVVGLSFYFEAAAVGFFILSVALFGYAVLRKKRAACKC